MGATGVSNCRADKPRRRLCQAEVTEGSGDWVAVNPRGLGGTHTPTNTELDITPQSMMLVLVWLQIGSGNLTPF